MTKVNLGQPRPSHVSETYSSELYWNAKVNQDMKVLIEWSKRGAIPQNWITKLELNFAERKKNMNNLKNKLQ